MRLLLSQNCPQYCYENMTMECLNLLKGGGQTLPISGVNYRPT